MESGFYPALGTPLASDGTVVEQSMKRQVDDLIEAGSAGMLVLGSMGIQASMTWSAQVKAVQYTVDAAQGRCPVFAGVMDNSIRKVLERIEAIAHLPIDGVVMTVPFYYSLTDDEVFQFYDQIAQSSRFPVYMYDLPSVTQTRIKADIVQKLLETKRIAGIKTADLDLCLTLNPLKHRRDPKSGTFNLLFSGLDIFDTAYQNGMTRLLDGMFSCTGPIAARMIKGFQEGDQQQAKQALEQIIQLRDAFVQTGVFGGFSYAMNALGYEGGFAPDYALPLNDEQKQHIRQCMLEIGLL